jgi:hypothetical protein
VGRVKYEVAGLQVRGQALAAQGHTREALGPLQSAVARARGTGDPAMFLRAAAALLAIDGDEVLLAEARTAVDRIAGALPDGDTSVLPGGRAGAPGRAPDNRPRCRTHRTNLQRRNPR